MDVVQHQQSIEQGILFMHSSTITYGQISNFVYRHVLVIGWGIYHSPQGLWSSPFSRQQLFSMYSPQVIYPDPGKHLQEATPSRSEPSSHTNYRYLSHSEVILRLSQEHHQCQLTSKQRETLKVELELISQKVGVSVDQELHDGLNEIMLKENENM